MKMSKIGSQNTYHKCLNDLDCWGYVCYKPSHHPTKGSQVYLFSFDTSTYSDSQDCRNNDTSSDQVLHNYGRKSDTSSIQALRSSINNINNLIIKKNNININNSDFEIFWNSYDKKVGNKEKISSKWNELSDCEREAALKYIPLYIKAQPNKQFRKNPENFLDNKSWNDEIIDSTASSFIPNIM